MSEIKPQFTDEQLAINELMDMSREELDLVDYDLKKWVCQCKGCDRYTRLRDYGISPCYFTHRKRGQWSNLQNMYLLCGTHWRFYDKMKKMYGEQATAMKLLAVDKETLLNIDFKKSNKLNS